jgi:DNA mismatch repair ATPase MutS
MMTISEIRAAHAGQVFLVWRGSVYEAWDGDAGIVARVCGAALRRVQREAAVHNVAEFPARDLNANLVKLKASGYRVELREQIEPRLP